MKADTIGFFEAFEEAGKHIGALMITDTNGIPAEFKYTEPIKPTRLQQILYGKSLEHYLKHDVIRAKLFKAMSKKPDFIFISNQNPSLIGECEGVPVIMIQRVPMKGLDTVGDKEVKKENEIVLREDEGREPLRIVTSPEHSSRLDEIASFILDSAYNLDLTEPLERIQSAMQAIIKEAKR
jgi:hypothetical protein